jgi:broad specificity phosphatase PhoE
MSKFTVYFVRHGLTTSNEQGLLCGSTDALVSEQGRRELHELKRLYPCLLYTSPSPRDPS